MNLRHIFLSLCFILMIGCQVAGAQQASAVSAVFTPGTFPGHPFTGSFKASFSKTAGTIPAGTAQVLFTMVPELTWNLSPITPPAGWTIDAGSTPTNIRFVLTADWTDLSDASLTWTIPVKAIGARSNSTLAVTSQIQQLDGDWGISQSLVRTSVTIADVPLPVTLISFNAVKEGYTGLLSWTTTAETNSERFDVERSPNGIDWKLIGSVASHGESSVLQKYTYTDATPLDGENLYRLKMIDVDNTFAYSKITNLNFTDPENLVVYPNPATRVITIKDPEKINSIRLYNVQGTTLLLFSKRDVSKTMDISSLNSGMYFLEYTRNNGQVRTSKINVVR